jgi:hypothetical protein
MNRWNVCAALRGPKDTKENSNNTNGVVRAVFYTSSGCTGIWRKARTRSMVENTVQPARCWD